MPKNEKGKRQLRRRAQDAEEIALYEEDLYEKEELKEETRQLVVFRLAQEWYGVEITKVKEVIKVEKITYLPSSPQYVAGIVNLRGNILSVTDLKRILGLPHEELTETTRIVAIEPRIMETGLLVDEISEAIEVPVSKIEPPLSSGLDRDLWRSKERQRGKREKEKANHWPYSHHTAPCVEMPGRADRPSRARVPR